VRMHAATCKGGQSAHVSSQILDPCWRHEGPYPRVLVVPRHASTRVVQQPG
jgi:hypothetical protein